MNIAKILQTMMHFTPQQVQGGGKFHHKTRIGNWLEDFAIEEAKMKDYLKKKDGEKLSISLTEAKFARSLAKAPLSFSEDGFLHFGQKVMILNKKTEGYLVIDVGDRITTAEEAYAVTTNNKGIGPMNRSVFIITRHDEKDGFEGDIVHFGQKIRIQSNRYISPKTLYLRSCPVSPQSYARFSRHQEVSMHVNPTYDTVWSLEGLDPNMRTPLKNQPVPVGTFLVVEHCGTTHYLASDLVDYRNDFGAEFEVSVHSYATLNKSQSLALEKTGKLTRDQATKFQMDQNAWMVVTAKDASMDYEDAPEEVCPFDILLNDIKKTLLKRGAYGIRGLGLVFKNMDKNGNRKLDVQEFLEGMRNYGISLSLSEAKAVVSVCDRDHDGHVDYNELLRYLRGDLSEDRRMYIKLAYGKLDKNKDGRVTLEDIAQIYDVSKHPDIISGKKTPEQVYTEFMSHWDTQIADGIVTLSEFEDYYRDVSASIDTDEYFAAMMKSAWKL